MGGTSANRLVGTATGSLDGDVLGKAGGEETHQITLTETASHTHPMTQGNSVTGSNTQWAGSSNNISSQTTGSAGSDAAHNNVQPTIVLNYLIYAGA
jgi:microcystin-dependent protein